MSSVELILVVAPRALWATHSIGIGVPIPDPTSMAMGTFFLNCFMTSAPAMVGHLKPTAEPEFDQRQTPYNRGVCVTRRLIVIKDCAAQGHIVRRHKENRDAVYQGR